MQVELAALLCTNKEYLYAHEKLKMLYRAAEYEEKLKPLAAFVCECLEADYKLRPTPEEMLQKWEDIPHSII